MIQLELLQMDKLEELSQRNKNLHKLNSKNVMTKNPISVDKEMLADAKPWSLMNDKKNNKPYVYIVKNKKNYWNYSYSQYT